MNLQGENNSLSSDSLAYLWEKWMFFNVWLPASSLCLLYRRHLRRLWSVFGFPHLSALGVVVGSTCRHNFYWSFRERCQVVLPSGKT